jgi:hypothetical protein
MLSVNTRSETGVSLASIATHRSLLGYWSLMVPRFCTICSAVYAASGQCLSSTCHDVYMRTSLGVPPSRVSPPLLNRLNILQIQLLFLVNMRHLELLGEFGQRGRHAYREKRYRHVPGGQVSSWSSRRVTEDLL